MQCIGNTCKSMGLCVHTQARVSCVCSPRVVGQGLKALGCFGESDSSL